MFNMTGFGKKAKLILIRLLGTNKACLYIMFTIYIYVLIYNTALIFHQSWSFSTKRLSKIISISGKISKHTDMMFLASFSILNLKHLLLKMYFSDKCVYLFIYFFIYLLHNLFLSYPHNHIIHSKDSKAVQNI